MPKFILAKIYLRVFWKISELEDELKHKQKENANKAYLFWHTLKVIFYSILFRMVSLLIIVFYSTAVSFYLLKKSVSNVYADHCFYVKKLRFFSMATFLFVIVTTIATALIFNLVMGPIFLSKAASYNFEQTGWDASASVGTTASHPGDRSDWTAYEDKDDAISISGALPDNDVTLSFDTSSTFTDDSQSEFDDGTYSYTQWDSGNSWVEGTNTTPNPIWELPDSAVSTGWIDMTGNVLLMHMNETSGTIADTSGQSNNGTYNGSLYGQTGKLNTALGFNGSSDYIEITDNDSLDFGTGDFTISAWFKATDKSYTQHSHIFSKQDPEQSTEWTLQLDSSTGNLVFRANATNQLTSAQNYFDDAWHHVVVTRDSGTFYLYVDGAQEDFKTVSLTLTNGQPLRIGRRSASYNGYFDGLIDETAAYNQALSATQISDFYNNQQWLYTGEYTSSVKDAGVTSSWDSFSWAPERPTGKEMPDSGVSETAYATGNANMTSNQMLLHFNESAGATSFSDTSGNNNDVSCSGGSCPTAGAIGKLNTALSFDGGDYIDTGGALNTYLDNDKPFSVLVWFKAPLTTVDYGQIFSYYDSTNSEYFAVGFYSTTGRIFARIGRGAGGSSPSIFSSASQTYNDNQWHFLSWTYAGGVGGDYTQKLYINNVFIGQTTAAPDSFASSLSPNIGAYNSDGSPDYYWQGSMDEFVFYSREISSTEIADYYKRGALRLKAQVRSCDDDACSGESFVGPDGTVGDYYEWGTTNAITQPSFNLTNVSNNRYFQYKAYYETGDSNFTPELKSMTANSTAVSFTNTLTSSAYNTASATNVITSLSWTEILQAGTDAQLQLRTADSEANLASAAWCGPDDEVADSCDSNSYFTDSSGGETIDDTQSDGSGDQWWQYKIILTSNGVNSPTFSDVTIAYVANSPPEFDAVYGTNGIDITNNLDGTFSISYKIKDIDTTSGTITPGFITPSIEYNIGSGWQDITSGYLASGDLDNKAVEESAYNTYTATWDAKSQIDGVYYASAQIRVTTNDNEVALNTAQANSAQFLIDTTDPTLASTALKIDGSDGTITIYEPTTEQSELQYQISNSIDGSNNLITDGSNANSAVWTAFGADADQNDYGDVGTRPASVAVSSWTLAGNPPRIYFKLRDYYGNTTSLQTINSPATPTNTIIQDISNTSTAEYKEFIAWGVVDNPSAGFAQYNIYRSTDGTNYAALTTVSDRATNYYIDSSLSQGTTYYYKVNAQDNNSSVSDYSNIVSDKADGQGGSDLTSPAISAVTIASTDVTSATITWTTDELSNSTVGYSTTSGQFDTEVGVASYVISHSVTLTGLAPNTTYYYQVKSIDASSNEGTDNNGGVGYSFTTDAGATISNVAVTQVSNSQSTISWDTDIAADTYVTYSVNSDLSSSTEVGSSSLVSSPFQHSIELTGLSQGTKYYFQVKSTDGSSNTATDDNGGDYYTFTTTSDSTPPVISNVSAGSITDQSAVISWTTDEGATSQVEYGGNTSYGALTTLDTDYETTHSVTLTDLTTQKDYYFRVLSIDINSNSSSDDNAGASYHFKTTRPVGVGAGITLISGDDKTPPQINNIKIKELTDTKVVFSWKTNEEANSLLKCGKIDEDEPYRLGFAVDSKLETYSFLHQVERGSLNPETAYHCLIMGQDIKGNLGVSEDQTFTTLTSEAAAQLPALEEEEAVTEEVSEPSKEKVKAAKKEEPACIGEDCVKISDVEQLSKSIVPILDNLKSVNYETVISYMVDKVFDKVIEVAAQKAGQPQFILQTHKREVSADSTTLLWQTDSNSSSIVALAPESKYSPQAREPYSFQVGNPQELVKEHRVTVPNLLPNTTYHYQLRSKGVLGEFSKSPDFTFTTETSLPEINNASIKKLTKGVFQIFWRSNIPATSVIEYTPLVNNIPDTEQTRAVIRSSLENEHSFILRDLLQATTYALTLKGTDIYNNQVEYILPPFKTSEDEEPPKILQVSTESAIFPGEFSKVQTIITWNTDEPSTSQVFWGEVGAEELNQKTSIDTSLSYKHTVVFTGLEPGQVYRFRVQSSDFSGNMGSSNDYTLLTPQKEQSILQLIISNFEDIFGWTKRFGSGRGANN